MVLNLFRWIKENLIVWVLLVSIYSLMTTMVLDTVFQIVFKYESNKFILWSLLFFGLMSAYFFESIGFFTLNIKKIFPIKNRYARLYALHEFRRGSGFLFALLLGGGAYFLGRIHISFILLIYLLCVQRPLFSLWKWRRLFLSFEPTQAAQGWYLGILITQVVYFLLFMIPVSFSYFYLSDAFFVKLIFGCIGGLLASLSVSFEGDSGTPVMVNLITFSSGVLGAFICFYSPWIVLLLLYLWWSMMSQIQNRFLSVEKLDEDFIIS